MPAAMRVVAPSSLAASYEGVVVAVPTQSVRSTVQVLPLDRSLPIVSGSKGLEPGSELRMSQVLQDAGFDRVAALSGPNLAREVVRGLPAAAVVAAARAGDAHNWQSAFAGGAFRVYTSDDIVGVEIGGALKNVVAIAAGAASGLGFGANAIAAILTRGLAEITRLGVALGAVPATFSGLAGIGDLAATCFSPLSRNHRLGMLLAQGRTPAQALADISQAVEGAATAWAAVALGARLGVDVPIAEQVVAVLDGRTSVPEAMSALLSRSLKAETA
jgi:glycerol-3-phosphate dehydrogenase (NAD(P)+)